ncbi:alpha-L-fucosidase [Streptomyces sp. ME02-6978a]|uniref:alpha-L-fucosidase n=1 Tax=Streptomyces TaxID=1883 RepID=UPI0029A08A65|nr:MULTISPECIES: alpha-L-fucosidase [unclassified Streptomyces]MDX3088653.1 alpha-L-fucosidase [Streptomyces sp. ME12-02E]MDX3331831.1 alpha-L-fucosidase [Streptomyces sp. ME02-6978a]
MALSMNDPERPLPYRRFEHATPAWFRDAKLGVFVHWGPYAVPAWAEPIGAFGTLDDEEEWFTHNPYAEWYHNTVRIEGSPARRHHLETYGGADYDTFLDLWRAESFDAGSVMDLVAATGARYFVPTTKHHDGVTLWDAPGTGDRNTVRRGPRRDLVGEFSEAAARRGIRFGVYYSGGLDWHVAPTPPIVRHIDDSVRPRDRAYADYVFDHVADLIERYRPELLWGDIEYPDAGKAEGGKSLVELFRRFYAARPEGVVNDRWGETHWDFRTSEYAHGAGSEGEGAWENCRGVGFSFGHNRLEDESHSLTGPEAVRHFLDVVSRGGNLLLNIGLTASGEVAPVQRRTLEALGAWNRVHGEAVFGSRPLGADLARPSERPWVRWTRTAGYAHAFVDAPPGTPVPLDADAGALDLPAAGGARAEVVDGTLLVTPDERVLAGPVRVDVPLR